MRQKPPLSFLILVSFSQKQISLIVSVIQWSYITCNPGLIDLDDLPDFQKVSTISARGKSPFITKAPSLNSITDIGKSTTPASPTSGFHPLKFSQEDVIKGKNSIYGTQTRLSNGGIIFAISQGQGQDSQSQQIIPGCKSHWFHPFIIWLIVIIYFSTTTTSSHAISVRRRNTATSSCSIHSAIETSYDGSSISLHACKATYWISHATDNNISSSIVTKAITFVELK